EMLLNAIGEMHFEFGVLPELLKDILRVALQQTASGARIAGGKRSDAILVYIQQRVLRIMGDETEAAQPIGMTESEPIIWRSVAEEIRDRCIQVAAIEDDQHVVDQIVDVEQHLVRRIARAVLVIPLHPLIIRIRSETGNSGLPKTSPRIHVAVRGEDVVPS